MDERKEILGIGIDCLSAKESMLCAMRYMENTPVDTIEIITMDTLLGCREDEAWAEQTESLGLLLPGDPEMLETAGIRDELREKEIRNRTFLKIFLKYLQKNRKKIYLLASEEQDMEKLKNALRRMSRGLDITGAELIRPADGREDEVVNYINATETDCIISALPSPYQEAFISRNRSLLNVKLWLGFGAVLAETCEGGTGNRIARFLQKLTFRRQAGKQQKNNTFL